MLCRRNGLAIVVPRLAPICNAPASLPTEPPARIVMPVENRMPGASSALRWSPARIFSMIASVVRLSGSFHHLYISNCTTPITGSSQMSHGARSNRWRTAPTNRHSTIEANPHTTPHRHANSVCRTTCIQSNRAGGSTPCRVELACGACVVVLMPSSARAAMPWGGVFVQLPCILPLTARPWQPLPLTA